MSDSKHKCKHDRRKRRQMRAEARGISHAKRSDSEQLMLLKDRPGKSEREVKRILDNRASSPGHP